MSGDRERQDESRRIIDRVAREANSSAFSLLGRSGRRAGNHFAATDADQGDRIEVWGSRIGRVLGLLLTIALFAWLALYLMRGPVG